MITKYIIIFPASLSSASQSKAKRTICEVAGIIFGLLAAYIIAGTVNGGLYWVTGLMLYIMNCMICILLLRKAGCFRC